MQQIDPDKIFSNVITKMTICISLSKNKYKNVKMLLLIYLDKMKAQQNMEEQARWFLKSYLQHQVLLLYHEPDPSRYELQKFIQFFSITHSQLDISHVIKQLYFLMQQASDSSIVPPLIYDEIMNINTKIQGTIIQKQKAAQYYQCKQNQSECKKIKFQNEQQKFQKKFIVCNKSPPTFQNQTQQNTYQTRRVIIQAYIQKQYGMTHLREFLMQHNLKIELDYKEYAGIINSLVTEGFRALERFLQQNCGIMVTSIKKSELRKLYPILLNMREWVTVEDFKIFVIFIRSLYYLASPSSKVSALAVYNIYQKILKLLSIRLIEVQSSSIKGQLPNNPTSKSKNPKVFYIDGQYQSNKISTIKNWTKQNEEQLIDFYLEDQDMSRIRQKYRQKYGQTTMFEKMNTLRSQLYQIIRKTLRRIQHICTLFPGQYSEEILESINLKNQERYVQLVNTSPQFVKARISLCKYYKTKMPNLIYQIAQELSDALKQKSKKQDGTMPLRFIIQQISNIFFQLIYFKIDPLYNNKSKNHEIS